MTVDSQHLRSDAWMTGIIGRDAYRLVLDDPLLEGVHVDADDSDADSELLPQLRRLQAQPVFIWTRVPTAATAAGRLLQRLGFYVVDTSLTFDKPVNRSPQFAGNCTVRAAVESDRDAVAKLAGNSFGYTRFHLDPAIDPAVADEIKARWAENYFAGRRGDDMLVAVIGDRIVGFVQLLHEADHGIIIDLIAVAADHRRQRIAHDMIAMTEARSHRERIIVGTQAANIPSVRLYEKLGFRLTCSSYVFHYHHDPANST